MARPRRRRWPQRLLSTLGVFVITAFALSSAGVFYAKRTIDSVASVDLSNVLTPEGKSLDDAGMGPTSIENYLIVGSDSRADVNPDDLDAGAIGNAQEVTGQRSDTIMILRFDPATNSSSLLSLPRDLWVPIAGTDSCQAAHTCYFIAGRMTVAMDDGEQAEYGPGDFAIMAPGHDAWTVGDEPCIVIDWQGFADYAKPHPHP